MRKAIVFGGIVVTFVRQAAGSPVVDQCFGSTIDGKNWSGHAIHLTPWRRNRYGDRLMGEALCIGRIDPDGERMTHGR